MVDESGNGAQAIANRGVGAQVSVQPLSRATAPGRENVVSAVIEIVPVDPASVATQISLGRWLVSDALGAPQTFSWMNRTWRLVIAPGTLL